MSVAPNGRIDVVYNATGYDSTFGSNTTVCMYTHSADSGRTWSEPEQFTPAWNPNVGYPQQLKIGDYYHMISDNGDANLAFSATFNGEQDVYFVKLHP